MTDKLAFKADLIAAEQRADAAEARVAELEAENERLQLLKADEYWNWLTEKKNDD